MRVVSLFRLPLFAAILALLLLGWVLFYWSSAFLALRQSGQARETATPMLNKVLAEKVVAMHLFGAGAAVGVPVAVAAPSSIGVSGVYAGRDGRSGFAVLVLDGAPISAVVGKEFAPGRVLQRAYPEYVEILHGGQLETAHMPNVSAAASTPQAVAPSAFKGRSTTLQMAVNQLGPGQFVLSREEMLATMKRSDQVHLLGQFTPNPLGGALLEQSPAGGLPEKLGLKVGDVITRINQKTLSGPGDVTHLNEQLISSEDVSMLVIRAGKKINVGIQVEQ
jgi:type II secretory pathway component PulC